ncbi:uncharacterized protein LOC132744130 [Ruditapes philippinarum]|uniref:uncharacterized protein LOC132744130 n=1 Tax=Ruditapes philippinarum TaxID=129788 RepID=UPI00295AE7F4|nr:uncharacterized protein LOC132744130 [Ruditapes philippinarum]
MFLFVLILVLFQLAGSTIADCKHTINNQTCKATTNNSTCVTAAENGTELTWFDMQAKCSENNGSLVHSEDSITKTQLLLNNSSGNFTYIRTGLLMSIDNDNKTFWRDPKQKPICGNVNTSVCLSDANETLCQSVGCCWLNVSCQYPAENQNVTEYKEIQVYGTPVNRQCVGFNRDPKSNNWTVTAYDCFETGNDTTGFVCEYECADIGITPGDKGQNRNGASLILINLEIMGLLILTWVMPWNRLGYLL